jgi:hypothetical protein
MIVPMPELTRRELLGAMAAAAAPIESAAKSAPELHIYAAESYGQAKYGWRLVVGMVLTKAPDPHLTQIKRLRETMRYDRPLRFGTTDRNRIPFAREMLRYFVSNNDLQFVARIFQPPNTPYSPEWRAAAHMRLYTEWYTNGGKKLNPGPIFQHYRRRDSERLPAHQLPEQQRFEGALRKLRPELTVPIARFDPTPVPEKNGLCELAVLLTGCLQFELAEAKRRSQLAAQQQRGGRVRARATSKTAVVGRLRELLRAPSLETFSNQKWRVQKPA